MIIILFDFFVTVLSKNLNSNDYSEYSLSNQIHQFFPSKFPQQNSTYIFNNQLKDVVDIYTGKFFNQSFKEFKTKQTVLLDLLHQFDSSAKCESEILNMTKFFYLNEQFQANFLHEVKEGLHLIIKCPMCEKENKKEKVWIKNNLSGSFEAVYESVNFTNKTNLNRTFISKNYSLIIKYFQLTDAGIYMCLDKDILTNLTNSSDIKLFIRNVYKIDQLEKIYLKNATDLSREKWWYFSELMFKINIYLLYSFKSIANQKFLKIESGLNKSNYSRIKYLQKNTKQESHYDNNTRLYLYSLWTNWSRCQMCQRKIKAKFLYRNAHCRVVYKGANSQGLLRLNRTFFPFGWPCSYLNIYHDLMPLEAFKKIPNNLVEVKSCNCAQVFIRI